MFCYIFIYILAIWSRGELPTSKVSSPHQNTPNFTTDYLDRQALNTKHTIPVSTVFNIP